MRQFALGSRLWIAGAMSVCSRSRSHVGHRHAWFRQACIISVALGQDQSAATAKDVIFARKVLMGSIGENMDDLDIIGRDRQDRSPPWRHACRRDSVLLLPFPHLFPPAATSETRRRKDAGVDTFASPDVWTRFSDFYQRSADASKIAYNAAGRATRPSSRNMPSSCAPPATDATRPTRRRTDGARAAAAQREAEGEFAEVGNLAGQFSCLASSPRRRGPIRRVLATRHGRRTTGSSVAMGLRLRGDDNNSCYQSRHVFAVVPPTAAIFAAVCMCPSHRLANGASILNWSSARATI